ncbi:alpha/beta hydrolase [Amycolatopsis nigrescens]|uniref:alpha/beta hydrolase n=1 Tax=Amycolatopsis nigrescens TaxID=381445 RepID=UPI000367C1C3|nr:alpha/beta hydrolase [Amycolatopsis nigrescens]
MKKNWKSAAGKLTGLSAIAVLAGSLALSGSAAAESGPPVSWHACFDGLECGAISVPADWARPGSARIAVGLGKLPARDQSKKVGTLLVNPGGPNPVLFALPDLKAMLPDLTEWFDVVVFDPRGMGESSGVTCPSRQPVAPQWPPPDRSAYLKYAAEQRKFALGCARELGPLRGKLNSWQVAHDMDAIRAALRQPKLSYFGNSYGTVYGQAYAELFGHKVSRMYLDSVADHTSTDLYDLIAPKAALLEETLIRFGRWCTAETSCALHDRDALAVWDRVVATATRQPIPAPGAGDAVTAGLSTIIGSGSSMVRWQDTWPLLATALAEADAGDATKFVPPPRPPGPDLPGAELMGMATCADLDYDLSHRQLKAVEQRLREHGAARVGWSEIWNSLGRCAGMPRIGTFPPHPIEPLSTPTLLANGAADSATPPEHGRRVAGQLGGRHLVAEGGHALYLTGNQCVRRHANHYLVTGELPPDGTTCT